MYHVQYPHEDSITIAEARIKVRFSIQNIKSVFPNNYFS